VSVPGRTWRRRLLAGRHAVVGVVEAGAAETVLVPVPADIPRRAELVVAVGESSRLRVVHRAVECRPAPPDLPEPVRPPLTRAR
jgi:hypothetical protein